MRPDAPFLAHAAPLGRKRPLSATRRLGVVDPLPRGPLSSDRGVLGLPVERGAGRVDSLPDGIRLRELRPRAADRTLARSA